MRHIVEEIAVQRMGKPLDKILKQNKKYQKRKNQYHEVLEEIKIYLKVDNSKDRNILLKLDEVVGDYSASYGDVAYSLGFHDGMEISREQREKTMKITIEDMANLIQIHDAYKANGYDL